MGFSWSSCVAQSTFLSICEDSGLRDRHLLACDSPLPNSLSLAFVVATNDLMIFSDAGPGITDAAARKVEDVMLARRIVKAQIRTLMTPFPLLVLPLISLTGDTGARRELVSGRCLMLCLTSLDMVSALEAPWQAT